jgi:hypothetical protein
MNDRYSMDPVIRDEDVLMMFLHLLLQCVTKGIVVIFSAGTVVNEPAIERGNKVFLEVSVNLQHLGVV